MVYVLNKDGKPLMPTQRHGKVRRLLRDGKAKVVRRCPFTIKLLYDTPDVIQDLTLGVDTGSSVIGSAVYAENGNILYTAKTTIRNDIKEKMDQRRQFRRTRRNRKTRYRKPRFLNRGNSIRADRFSPTMVSKIHSHVKEIESVKSILPISKLVLETATFDPHLMKNPALANEKIRHWGYQRGANYGFENTKAMVLNRDGYKCHICKNKKKGVRLEVHHIVFRSNGGSNEADNLITLCHDCHKKLHDGKVKLNLKGKPKGQLNHATQMNSIRLQLLKYYPEAIETFGYVTKANRQVLSIEKDHHIDACIIASGGLAFTVKSVLQKKLCIAKGQYKLTDGKHSENKPDRTPTDGFSANCKVKYFGKEYFIAGVNKKGYAILKDIDGNKIDFSYMGKGNKTPKLRNMKRISARKTTLIMESKNK